MNKVVTVSIFVFAVGYSLLTGPFRGADEPNHFFRAFHVSEGGVLAMHGPEGIVGQFLPANLLTLVQVAGALTKTPAIKTFLPGITCRRPSPAEFKSSSARKLSQYGPLLPIKLSSPGDRDRHWPRFFRESARTLLLCANF